MRRDPKSKALVFSLYTDSLKYVAMKLGEHGFDSTIVTGSVPLRAIAKTIHAFQHDAQSTVLLLSATIGAVGVNLTAADHVFLLDVIL